jgi:sulfhydrogenase subunit gamma (sulfur reductase)
MASAVLSSRQDAGGELLLITLEVAPEVARAYRTPGQYVEVKTSAGKGYFVLASDVGATPWEMLVKSAGEAAEALGTLPLGSVLPVEGPLGAGFSVERMSSRHVAVAVVGSAISVARPVVRQRIRDGAAATTHVFVGVRSLADLPIATEIQEWCERGIAVVLCLSRSELHHHPEVLPKAHRVGGYVQRALAHALQAGEVPHGTLVITAGPDAMLADMRALASGGADGAFLAGPSLEVLTNV